MSSLDTLARSAADAVHESVADLSVPAAPVGIAAGVAAAWRMVWYAAAGAAAGAAALAVLFFIPINEDTPTDTVAVTTTIESIVTTSAPTPTTPAPTTPVVVDPGGSDPTTTVPPTTEATTTIPADTEPPSLVVVSPADRARFEKKTVTFSGTTEPGATVIASGKFAVPVDGDGAWSIDLVLASGANGVVFVATDDAGNTSEARLTVYYDAPPQTTTTTKAEKGWEFSAFQKYGSCAEPVPYDEFWGTGKPGGTITVASPYGSGSTTVDAEGNFWIRVEFPSAPFGETFSVKVKDEFGNKKVFSFVSNYSG